MKAILLLLFCLSSLPLLAQRSIKVVSPKRCPIMYYHRTDTGDVKITKPTLRARSTNMLLFSYQCDGEAAKVLHGATLYLIITDFTGKEITDVRYNIPTVNINGQTIIPYAEGVYNSDRGITFEIVPPNGKWTRGEAYSFRFYNEDVEIARKILFFN